MEYDDIDNAPAEPTWLELGIMSVFALGGYGIAYAAIFAAVAVLAGWL